MNLEIKKQWTDALRSGEYEQAEGALNAPGTEKERAFCCLGVLCDLAVKAGIVKEIRRPAWPKIGYSATGGMYGADYADSVLPPSVMEWAGLDLLNPEVDCGDGSDSLAGLNDAGHSFAEIADLIDAQL